MSLPPEVKPIVARLTQLQDALRADFVDRDEVVRLLVLAAVCHEHVLLLGPPGTAKTELVNRFADLVRAKRFHYQLTRFTEPTELFGPMDLARFQQGEYHIVTTNMLPEAQVVFLDEVFQGSSAILNTLLTLVNERVFFNGAVPQRCPLIGLIGASNTLPDDAVLRAFADRFLLRALVNPVEPDRIEALLELGWQAEQSRVRAASREGEKAQPLLDAEQGQFDVLQQAVARVDVRPVRPARPAYADAVRELRANGVEMSDRRVVRGLKLVAGAALLRGSMTAAAEDLWPLRHCWTRPEEAATLRQVLGAHLGDDRAAAGPERLAAELADDLGVLDDHAAAAAREGQVVALLAQYNAVRREVLRDHPDNAELRTRVERGVARLMDTLARLEEGSRVYPRRVNVTATRDLAEAWRREVSRTARAAGRVAGEARVRRPLAAAMSDQVVRAFEAELAAGAHGWRPDGDDFRADLPGGYVVYHPDDRSVEIVARLEEDVEVEGTATETVGGELTGTAEVQGEGMFYDDNYGGRDEEAARRDADADAARRLAEEVRRRLDEAARAGEDAADATVRARAEAAARSELAREADRRRAALEREAAGRLDAFTVGAMRAVNQCLGSAYRRVLTAQARARGATDLVERDDGDTVSISFRLPG